MRGTVCCVSGPARTDGIYSDRMLLLVKWLKTKQFGEKTVGKKREKTSFPTKEAKKKKKKKAPNRFGCGSDMLRWQL